MQENQSQEESTLSDEVSELDKLKQELVSCQDKYLRLLAESENSRKRLQKERQELTKYAISNVLAEFLHPLDSFEKALKFAENMSDEVRNWAVGFEMILSQFKQVLSNHGVVEYPSLGKHFDPHLHEAVEMIETSEFSPGTVMEEFVRGYKMGDRVVRVARVKVAKAPMQEEKLDV